MVFVDLHFFCLSKKFYIVVFADGQECNFLCACKSINKVNVV